MQQLLYAIVKEHLLPPACNRWLTVYVKKHKQSATFYISGGGERIRTDDLLRARQALSQLSYTPDSIPPQP